MGLEEAESLIRRTDLMLVLGSSLTVYPAAFLPQLAQGEIVIINKGPAAWPGHGQTYFLDDDLDTVFHQIAKNMDIPIPGKI